MDLACLVVTVSQESVVGNCPLWWDGLVPQLQELKERRLVVFVRGMLVYRRS